MAGVTVVVPDVTARARAPPAHHDARRTTRAVRGATKTLKRSRRRRSRCAGAGSWPAYRPDSSFTNGAAAIPNALSSRAACGARPGVSGPLLRPSGSVAGLACGCLAAVRYCHCRQRDAAPPGGRAMTEGGDGHRRGPVWARNGTTRSYRSGANVAPLIAQQRDEDGDRDGTGGALSRRCPRRCSSTRCAHRPPQCEPLVEPPDRRHRSDAAWVGPRRQRADSTAAQGEGCPEPRSRR